ncbi:hypothetical protein LTR09_011620 [Extremus antarcticus]|uniref:LYC1 C-terminal domain-containing protein n=1 Tax=Extremus antarcticus TaxID=702011 RepID=A0AAJ0G4W6_9PEZI|nr:hypothetical protein LTR09_011620 [Extremus antarcticus]
MGSIGEPNGHIELPDKNDPAIQLVVADQDEIIAQQEGNSIEWRGALSKEAYLRREVHLASTALTEDGGLTCWALVYQPSPDRKRQVLCGCETIRKKALVSRDGKVEETTAHGIGSVFCPPEFRGKGYAGRMMSDLGKRLQSWQAEESRRVLFTVLFSDIGKKFYARNGWQPFPSSHVSLVPTTDSIQGLPPVSLLNSEDLVELCNIDEKLIRNRMTRSAQSTRSEVALVPDISAIRWHHCREEFVANELFGRHPDIKGAVTGDVGSRVWCYWTRVYTNPREESPNTLHILRLVVEDESISDFAPATAEGVARQKGSQTVSAMASLLVTAQDEAITWDMKKVQIWNPTSTTLAAVQLLDDKAAVQHRESESIASLRWHGEGSWEEVDWICNEKYGWC